VAYLTLIQPSSVGIQLTDMSSGLDTAKTNMSNDEVNDVNNVNSLSTDATQSHQCACGPTADRFPLDTPVATVNSADIPPTARNCSTTNSEHSSDLARTASG